MSLLDLDRMDNSAKRRRARDCFEAFAPRDAAWLKASVAPTHVRRDTTLPFPVPGQEGVLEVGDLLPGTFSEIELDLPDTVAEGDKVLVWSCFGGVHGGPRGDHPASGRRFDVAVLDLLRMADNRIAGQWPAPDNLGLQQQIGLLPS